MTRRAVTARRKLVTAAPLGVKETSGSSVRLPTMVTDQVEELMNEAYATRLLDALQPGPPSVRIHDGVALLPS
jgi:8-oxo-dGTP diphosphatase